MGTHGGALMLALWKKIGKGITQRREGAKAQGRGGEISKVQTK